MTYQEISIQIQSKLNEAQLVVEMMPQKGLTPDTCQRTAIIEKLREVENLVSGITEEDLL